MKLPRYLGVPCGCVVLGGYIYLLTTDGEIFRLQLGHMVRENEALAYKSLIHDKEKCIVETPNQCIIERVHFEKGTKNFPALVNEWQYLEVQAYGCFFYRFISFCVWICFITL
jgi:hypothetical protein